MTETLDTFNYKFGFADTIASYKADNEFTVGQVAEKCGVTESTIHNWTKGKHLPNVADRELIRHLSTVIGLPEMTLVGTILHQLGYMFDVHGLFNSDYAVFKTPETEFFALSASESQTLFERPMFITNQMCNEFYGRFNKKLDKQVFKEFVDHIKRSGYKSFNPCSFLDEDLYKFLTLIYDFDIRNLMLVKAQQCLLYDKLDEMPSLCRKDGDQYLILSADNCSSALYVENLREELKHFSVNEFLLRFPDYMHRKVWSDIPSGFYTRVPIGDLDNVIDINEEIIEVLKACDIIYAARHALGETLGFLSKNIKAMVKEYQDNEKYYEQIISKYNLTDKCISRVVGNECGNIPILTTKGEKLIQLYERIHEHIDDADLFAVSTDDTCLEFYIDSTVTVNAIVVSLTPRYVNTFLNSKGIDSNGAVVLNDIYVNDKYENTSICLSGDEMRFFDNIPVGSHVLMKGMFVKEYLDKAWSKGKPWRYYKIRFVPSEVKLISK